MITLSNGHVFEYMTASGALGYDGKGWPHEKALVWLELIRPELFTNVAKTITVLPRQGNFRWDNPFGCVRFMRGGVLNAVGMGNNGSAWWYEKIGRGVSRQKESLIASVYFESEPQMEEMAKMLNLVDLVGVEVNARCPNLSPSPYWQCPEAIVRNCREFKILLRHPLLLKLSVEDKIKRILPWVEGFVEAVSINSVRWKVIFPNKKSPLVHLGGGGVSGKITQPIVWPFISDIARYSSIPVIGSAIWDFDDLARVRAAGAKAISFGSVFMPYPWRPASFVRKEMEGKS